MELPARYHDGIIADAVDVTCRLRGTLIEITDGASGAARAAWPAADVYPLHGRRNELRLGLTGRPYGERLVFTGYEASRMARSVLPALDIHYRRDAGRQLRLMGLATIALASVILAYVFGVPLLAERITTLVPPDWEAEFGTRVAVQIEAAMREEGGFEICDTDRQSLANRAIRRFADAAVAGSGSPFAPDVQVVRSELPNAFALPGGTSFYFSALLDATETQDEFAGVLAHELGHVVHRHALRQLIASAGTGLLIGFVLGDMTGISVAGGLGAALIDSHFSREEELQADLFASLAAQRLGFRPTAFAELLQRVAGDDSFTRALSLLSTHPLTEERRRALESVPVPVTAMLNPAFSDAEWLAIKAMCTLPTSRRSGPSPSVPDRKFEKGS